MKRRIGTSSNVELEQLCKEHGVKLRGTYTKDEMDYIPKRAGAYILNMAAGPDLIQQGAVGHWVCFVKSGSSSVFFDSFGCVPQMDAIEFLYEKTLKQVFYNEEQIQDMSEDYCGHICVMFLHWMQTRTDIKRLDDRLGSFIGLFDLLNIKRNRSVVQRFIDQRQMKQPSGKRQVVRGSGLGMKLARRLYDWWRPPISFEDWRERARDRIRSDAEAAHLLEMLQADAMLARKEEELAKLKSKTTVYKAKSREMRARKLELAKEYGVFVGDDSAFVNWDEAREWSERNAMGEEDRTSRMRRDNDRIAAEDSDYDFGAGFAVYSDVAKVRAAAAAYLGPGYTLRKSTDPEKKFMVLHPDTRKWIHFGAAGYEDYTAHGDEKRRASYLQRTANLKGAWRDDKYSPNNLSRHLLWSA